MAVIEKKYWTGLQALDRGVKKPLGWLQHDNFAFHKPGYGILVNGKHLPMRQRKTSFAKRHE
jgi:hypothetical protein